MRTRVPAALLTTFLTVTFLTVAVLARPAPASAARSAHVAQMAHVHTVTIVERVSVAVSWTQPSATSRNRWNTARVDQARWGRYEFDWSTDYCSSSPDKPMGFDFRLPCHRHDFGYRNFRRLDVFAVNKAHVDDAFYVDMKAVCAPYPPTPRKTCVGIAWTYYQAVKKFGALLEPQQQFGGAVRTPASVLPPAERAQRGSR